MTTQEFTIPTRNFTMKSLLSAVLGVFLLVIAVAVSAEETCPCSFKSTDRAVNALKGQQLDLMYCLQEPELFQIDIIEKSKVDGVTIAVDASDLSLQCNTVQVRGRRGTKVEHYKLTKKQAYQCMAELKGLVRRFEERLGKEVIGTCKP